MTFADSRRPDRFPRPWQPTFTAVRTGLFGLAARRAPQDGPIYLEVEKAGSARCSYDMNFCKPELRVADAMPAAQAAGALLGVEPAALQPAFDPHAKRPPGHISDGLGHGNQPSVTWYREAEPPP